MQISPDTMRLLMEMDAPAEQKVALMKAMEADWLAYQAPAAINGVNEERERLRNESTYAERKRAKDRERQRRLREEARQSRDIDGDPATDRATSTATEGDSPATRRDAPRTYAQVVTPFSSSLRSEEVGGGGGEREHERASDDWPAGKARDHAKLLVELVASPRLDPSKSPGLVTTMGRLEAWRRDGASWEHDVIPVVTALCAKQRGPVSTWKFFDQPIARSIADNRAALAIPEADPKPRGQGPPRSFGEQIAAEHHEARRRVLES